jgi:hypothetical protein
VKFRLLWGGKLGGIQKVCIEKQGIKKPTFVEMLVERIVTARLSCKNV